MRKTIIGCRWVSALLLTGALTLPSTGTHSQEAIGNATAVIPQAEGTQGANTRPLAGGSAVYRKSRSVPEILASRICNSTIKLNLALALKLRSYWMSSCTTQIDPGSAVVEVARGSFRLVTGKQSKGVTYQIKTPFGTLGVRG